MKDCFHAGQPVHVLEADADGVWVTLSFASAQVTTYDTPVETPVKTRVETPEFILAALRAKPDWTLAELARSIGKSLSAVERATAKLVKDEKLRFVGPKKGGHWEVLK